MGGRADVAKGSVVAAEFSGDDGKTVCPLHLWKDGGLVCMSFSGLLKRPGLEEEAARRRHYDEFNGSVGPLTSSNLQGFPAFKVAALADAEKRAALTPLAKAFIASAVRQT